MTMPTHGRSRQYVMVSPYERAKLERRIITSIRQGLCLAHIKRKHAGTTDAQIKQIAAAHGLEIKITKGGYYR